MSIIHLVAIGLGVFGLVMLALLGMLGTFEAIEYQNKKAREKNERL